MTIHPINVPNVAPTSNAPIARPPTSIDQPAFENVLSKIVGDADSNLKASDKAIHSLVTGEKDSLHEVVASVAKAEMSFRLMLEIRNKLVESYQEIMRMQV